jgi:hypothetical protein
MDAIVVAIPIAIVALVVSTIAYGLSHRNPKVAWRTGWRVVVVLWSVATIAAVLYTHPDFCSILPVEGPDGTTNYDACNPPHWPTVLGYGFGYLVIGVLAMVTRPRASRR